LIFFGVGVGVCAEMTVEIAKRRERMIAKRKMGNDRI